jgi:hypothetical protein
VEGALLLGWAAAFLAGPPADLASCPRGSLAEVVTHVRDGDTTELGSLAIRLHGLAAPEGEEPVAPRRAMRCVPLCSVAACAASSTVSARTTDTFAAAETQLGGPVHPSMPR